MNRDFVLSLVAATLFGWAAPAFATHGSALQVDTIDGSGPLAVNGTLSNPSDSADWYSFAANVGDSVTISLQSTDFDTFLFLYKTPGIPMPGDLRSTYTQVAEDDDGGGSTNSLISIPALAQAGNYLIAAESFSSTDQQLGVYHLTVSGSIHSLVPEPSTISLALLGFGTIFRSYLTRRGVRARRLATSAGLF
jgi:hypothetical protein